MRVESGDGAVGVGWGDGGGMGRWGRLPGGRVRLGAPKTLIDLS